LQLFSYIRVYSWPCDASGVEWGGCFEVCRVLSLGAWDLGREVQGGWPPVVSSWAQCRNSVVPQARFAWKSCQIANAWFNLTWSEVVEDGSCHWIGAEEGCALAPLTMSWNGQTAFRQTIHLGCLRLLLRVLFLSVMETCVLMRTVPVPQQSSRARTGCPF
jgi:hypothetical protein